MLCAGWCFPSWKPVVPEENLSGVYGIIVPPPREKKIISVKGYRLGCPMPGGTTSPKGLQAAVAPGLANLPCPWNTIICSLPAGHFGTHSDNAAWTSSDALHPEWPTFTCWVTSNLQDQSSFLCQLEPSLLRTCQYSGFFQAEFNPLTDFSLEGQCHSGTGSSTRLREPLFSEGFKALARQCHSWPDCIFSLPWPLPCSCQGHLQSLWTSTAMILVSLCTSPGAKRFNVWLQGTALVYSQGSPADDSPLTGRETGWGAEEQQAALSAS